MEKRIEKIIKTKEYIKLSTEELMLIQDWVEDENQFYEMKDFMNQVDGEFKDLKPSNELKKNLMQEFREVHGKPKEDRRILYMTLSTAAVLLVAVLIYWPSSNSNELMKNQQIAQNDEQIEPNQEDEIKPDQPVQQERKKLEKLPQGIIESKENIAQVEKSEESEFEKAISTKDAEVAPMAESIMPANLDVSTNFSTANRASFTKTDLKHRDFLSQADLPATKKEFVQNHPNVLQYLYTAY